MSTESLARWGVILCLTALAFTIHIIVAVVFAAPFGRFHAVSVVATVTLGRWLSRAFIDRVFELRARARGLS